jgi:hypothetical protein
MRTLAFFKYDVVWYWKHDHWMPAEPNVSASLGGCAGDVDALVTRLERAGYQAKRGTRAAGPPEGAPRGLDSGAPSIREAVLSVTEMRDVAIPEHVCILNIDDTNHCTKCGERVLPLKGATQFIMGVRS